LGGVARGRNPGHTDTLARSVTKAAGWRTVTRPAWRLTVSSEDEFSVADLATAGAGSEAAVRRRCRQLADTADPIDPDPLRPCNCQCSTSR
jgi:hypothetical protein